MIESIVQILPLFACGYDIQRVKQSLTLAGIENDVFDAGFF